VSIAYFTYSQEQWDRIKRVVLDRLGKDADLIGSGGASLRDLIEIEAGLYLAQDTLDQRADDREARIDRLSAAREASRKFRDDIAPFAGEIGTDAMLGATEAYIGKLTCKIDMLIALRIDREGNIKIARQRLWTGLIVIWREIGGSATGVDMADFIIAASAPAIKANEMPARNAVIEWLRVRGLRYPDLTSEK
jgi:hypothetical protein